MSAASRIRDLERALAALPENVVGEILFGRLVTQPRPAFRHARAVGRLGVVLGSAFDRGFGGPGGWFFAPEPELALGPHVLVPEIAGWRSEGAIEADFDVARVAVPPDWVCEVLSPSTATYDRDEKALIYGANGVEFLWFVDPVARTIEALRSERGRWSELATFSSDDVARVEPFDAIEMRLGELWLG